MGWDALNTCLKGHFGFYFLDLISINLVVLLDGQDGLTDFLKANLIITGPSMNLRRKTVFLINSLAMQSASIISSLRTHGLLHTLVTSVSPLRGIPAGLDGELSPQDED